MDDDDDECKTCDCCGGDGFVSYLDHHETWEEDCPTYEDHLTTCHECGGSGVVR